MIYLTLTQDDPRQRPGDPEPDWVSELQTAIRCQKILESANNDLKVDQVGFHLRGVADKDAARRVRVRDKYNPFACRDRLCR